MRFQWSGFLGGFVGAVAVGVTWTVLGAAAPADLTRELNVQRINIREPDGTLRMTISNHARMPGMIVGPNEYPHPNRPEAGLIFYNDEGIENGGLVFDGGMRNGRPTNTGGLTFDRYRQDQTVQLGSIEDGEVRRAGLTINDRPDAPLDFAALTKAATLTDPKAAEAAARAANAGGSQRAFLGRAASGASQLELRDADGKVRLLLKVTPDGDASIVFRDATGATTKTITP